MNPARKSLIPKFILITLLIGVLSGLEHALFPPADGTYTNSGIIAIFISMAGYFFFFRNVIRAAAFKGDGKLYFPHAYYVTCFITVSACSSAVHHAAAIPEQLQTFLISAGVFITLYALAIFISWRMMKTGDEDWGWVAE